MTYTLFNTELLDRLSGEAQEKGRRRTNHNLHVDYNEPCQRFLNAVEPDSYIRPHRHLTPPKPESFIVLRGRLLVLLFDDQGTIIHTFLLTPGGSACGADLAPGLWHTVVALDPGTVFFEAKPGPYAVLSDKDFAPWAPAEGVAASPYLERLRQSALRVAEQPHA